MKKIINYFLQRFALNAFISENYELALKYFIRMMKINPEFEGICYNIALCHMGLGQYERAEEFLNRHAWKYGQTHDIERTFGDLYYFWGNIEEAVTWYTRCLKSDSKKSNQSLIPLRIKLLSTLSDGELLTGNHEKFKEAVSAIRKKDYDSAENLLREVILFDPSNVHAYNNLGVVLKEGKGDFAEAEKMLACAFHLSESDIYKVNMKKLEQEMRI